jgi:hypothetical protein
MASTELQGALAVSFTGGVGTAGSGPHWEPLL